MPNYTKSVGKAQRSIDEYQRARRDRMAVMLEQDRAREEARQAEENERINALLRPAREAAGNR